MNSISSNGSESMWYVSDEFALRASAFVALGFGSNDAEHMAWAEPHWCGYYIAGVSV